MKIVHVADVHIFLNKRHEEHEHVFNKLYKSLKENEIDRIFLGGDIFHSKTVLSPEAVKTAFHFFWNLSQIAPVDIIVGNHDCFTEDHELLTFNGWKSIKNIVDEKTLECVATFNTEENNIEFQSPLDYIEKNYKGELINFLGKDIDLCVTKTHNILYRFKSKYKKIPAEQISLKSNIPINGILSEKEKNIDKWYELLGFVFADATIVKRGKTAARIQFHFKKERKILYCKKLLEDLNIKYSYRYNEIKKDVFICFYSQQAKNVRLFFKNGKQLDWDILKLTRNQLYSFVYGYLNGDGCKNKTKNTFYGAGNIFKKNIDILYTISRFIGGTSHKDKRIKRGLYENSKLVYCYNTNLNNNVNFTTIQNKKYIDFNGKVYCVSVKNENLLVRRNGKIFITGNCNLKNNERLDSIRPIVDTISTNQFPITVYPKSGIYNIDGNVVYGVFSCLDEENFPIEFERENNKTYIALFHGAISDVKLNDKFNLEDTGYSADMFKNYDFGFFGDIHIPQSVGGRESLRYCGSLMPLDFSECKPHGYLLWDLDDKSYEFIEIKSDWMFYDLKSTIKFTKNNIPDFGEVSKYPRIKLSISNQEYTLTEKKELELAIREKYNPIELQILVDPKKKNQTEEYKKLGSVTELPTQQDLLKTHFKDDKNVDKNKLHRILEINKITYNQISRENILKNITWKLKSFSFNNLFSFGEKNIFNFEKYKGIVLINGANAKGKTNFFNALLYVLFNTTDKTSEIKDIINYNKKDCSGHVQFEVDKEIYSIERKSSKGTKSTSTSLDFTKFDDKSGQWISKNSDTRPNTDKVIQKTIGSYDDIIISSFSPQGKVSEFLDKGKGDAFLLDLISKFLGVNIYKEMHDIANKEYKKIKNIFDSFEQLDYSGLILECKNNIVLENEKITILNNNKDKINNEFLELDNKIEINQSLIEKIPQNVNSDISKESQALKKIEDKKSQRETLLSTIQSYELRKNMDVTTIDVKLAAKKTNKEKELVDIEALIRNFDTKTIDPKLLEKKSEKEIKISNIRILITKIEDWIKTQDINLINSELEKQRLLSNKQNKLELQISKKEAETKKDLQQVDILNKQSWNDEEEICKKCELYINASKLRTEINFIKDEIELLLTEFETNKKEIFENEHYKDDLSLYEKREKELLELKNRLSLELSNLGSIELEITMYLENRKSELKKLNVKLETEKSNLNLIGSEILLDLQKREALKEKLLSDIELKKSELNTIEAQLKNLILEYKEIKTKNKEYEKYIEIEKRNKELNQEILNIKANIVLKKNELNNIQYDIVSSEKHITEYETKIQQLNETLEKIKKYEEMNSDYEYYMRAIHREGIPYNIINMYVDIINTEINKILEQIEDFKVYLEPNNDDKSFDIKIYHQDGKSNKIQLGSGMEKTLTAIAIRDALTNISNIPKCNVFVMDESIQTFDHEHLSTVGKLFEYLKGRYDTIFIISHLDEIKDYANHMINVDNNSGYTKFEFIN